jgi:phenylacetate-coenzyme A ligase PaaK-like adenylate-forming protein
LQGWNRKGLTFLADMVFLEFIPYEEELKPQDNESYQPSTVLLDEVEEGKLYEVIITQFYGMPLLRYRLNDVVKIIAMEDEEVGINLPQISFHHRVGEVINLGGLCWLDEKTVWQALYNTGVKFIEWAACKEYDNNQTFLRLYLELNKKRDADEVANMIDEQLKLVDTNYWELHSTLNLKPVRVTLLSPGTFRRYTEEKIGEGADLAHWKPVHMNPPELHIQRLLHFSEVGNKK